eukprot:CAMPEP_0172306178 /NCGR_PEP_ID=MMETSP1058-20130122/7306_1 /TAXON_ID=83371 /ORGANISM="Detonula confervacea, Strain CCMP 353" /LENGTH=66 /DNA_ID=CAMNT_0013017981 /DNA_START=590 /DNA_END=787 /DNA_ORIENTATION=-
MKRPWSMMRPMMMRRCDSGTSSMDWDWEYVGAAAGRLDIMRSGGSKETVAIVVVVDDGYGVVTGGW